MTVLNDGSIVVVWRASNAAGDGDPTKSGTGIKARILNPDGSLTGTEFTVNSTTLNGQDAASVATLSDGRFVVTWHSNENGDGGSGANLTIRARVFNADGTPAVYNGSTNDFVVNDIPAAQDISPVVVAVPGGGFVITWQQPPSFFAAHEIEMRVFTNTGPAGGQQIVSGSGTHSGEPVMTALAGGKYVVGWRNDMGGTDDMLARIFNADGTPAAQGGVLFTLSTSTLGDQYSLDLATLSDGRFVAVWTTNTGSDGGAGDGDGEGIRARVFNADGTPDMTVNGGNDFIVNTTTGNAQTRAQVVGLADGRFLISFASQTDPLGNPETNVLARLFNANGTPDGNDFVIEEVSSGTGGTANALVRTLDGRALSLYDRLQTGPEALYGRFLDFAPAGVTLDGDGGDNTLFGTGLADVLNGLGGADTIYGGGEFDLLNGGPGTDTLKGGSGGDTFNGGADNDTMIGGLGINVFVLAPGDGTDAIFDFDEGSGIDDRLDLTAFTSIHTRADVLALATQSGADTVIAFGGGDVVTLIDVVRNNLADDDFIFASVPPNDPPAVASPIADQSIAEDTAWNFQFPAGAFTDPNGDTLSYSATLGNNDPLPAWLGFNSATRTFSGTPPLDFTGTLDLKVTASDGSLSASDVFVLTVTSASPQGTPGDDSFTAPAGSASIDAVGGVDTITFDFRLVDATVTYRATG